MTNIKPIFAGACLALMLSPALAAGEVYKYTGKDGVTVYTNIKPEGVPRARVKTLTDVPLRSSAPRAEPAAATSPSPASNDQSAKGSLAPQKKPVADAEAPKPKRANAGAIYRYTDKSGVTVYTNIKPNRHASIVFRYSCVACEVTSSVNWNNVGLNTTDYSKEIRAAAAKHGVDEALVRAVIHAESGFRKNALSHKGAQGLMQLIPATADRFGVSDPFNASENIEGGVAYLKFLMQKFDGNIKLVTAAYNAGEGAVSRHGGVPPYSETQVYVERVGILHRRYRDDLAGVAGKNQG